MESSTSTWTSNTIEDEIQRNSLEYGVAVNTDRSIPDAASGLKPVARRIIYDAFVEGRTSNKPHVKSARIVGDTMGRFHPHGDSSIYGAMVRLSQDWIMRYPLIDIHGNNGTILGDGPAAMRYTEARLSKISEDGLLQGLKKKNVPFALTFDESEEEPLTLPAIFPNLLCNPNEGIGWAMGCSWAPHNLREVAQAIYDVMCGREPYLPGPDFPTGGLVINKNDIPAIMKTGKGKVIIRGRYKVKDKTLIFYEIPYGTQVETLLEQIAKASEEGKLDGVIDAKNATSKSAGLQIEIETDGVYTPETVADSLFRETDLQTTFNYNQIALKGKTPVELNLKQAIEIYINHNVNCLLKETQYDLDKATLRMEILRGLTKALDNIDGVINIIKKAPSPEDARFVLITTYGFTNNQVKAILEMKLSRLTRLETAQLKKEESDLYHQIEDYKALLGDKVLQLDEIKKRLDAIVKEYGDDRRTELVQFDLSTKKGKETKLEKMKREFWYVVITDAPAIMKIPEKIYNPLGLRGSKEKVLSVTYTNSASKMAIFTSGDKFYHLPVDRIPVGKTDLMTLLTMKIGERPVGSFDIGELTEDKVLCMLTDRGYIKKVYASEYATGKAGTGAIALAIRDTDGHLSSVFLAKDDDDIIILTSLGRAEYITLNSVSRVTRKAGCVLGMSVSEDDYVCQGFPIEKTDYLAIFNSDGSCKKVDLSEIPYQRRGGKGVLIQSKSSSTVAGGCGLSKDTEVLLVGEVKNVIVKDGDIPLLKRASKGSSIIHQRIDAMLKLK